MICDGLRASEVLERVPGLTYRKLDYWRSTGRLNAHTHDGLGRGGLYFCWPLTEVAVAALLLQLTAHGMELGVAANLARDRSLMLDLYRILGEALAVEEKDHE